MKKNNASVKRDYYWTLDLSGVWWRFRDIQDSKVTHEFRWRGKKNSDPNRPHR